MRGLALIALVVAGAARAQPVVTRFDIDNQEVLRLNAEDCDIATARMFLQVQVTEPQYQLRFVEYPRSGPLGACPLDRNEPLATEVFAEEQQIPVGTEILLQRDLARPALLGDGACPTDTTPGLGRRAENFFCVQFFLLPGDLNAVGAAQVSIDVDTTVPPVPTLTRIDAIDQTVTVGVEAITPPEGDAVSFVVQHRRCATSTGEGEGEGEGEAGNESEGEGEGEGEGEAVASLCGATGGFTEEKGSAPAIAFDVDTNDDLELRVFAVDDFGNASAPTELVLVSPAASLSALALYDGDANALSCAPSGCGDTDAAGLVGALALLRLRPRRRRATCSPPSTTSRGSAATTRASGGVAVALLVVLGAAPAHAGEDERLWPGLGRTTVSLGVSSWLPNLDAQTTFPVYGCLFDDATQARVGGDGDLHLWDGFGSIAVTAGLELAQASGFAQPVTTATSRTCGKPTSTTVNLTAAMGRLGLTYRFDPLLDAWSVPLVPYGRVGLLGTGYLFSKDGASDTSSKTHNPVGARFGYEAAGGLMLALDFLDVIDPFSPGTTRRARASGVFDHTFLFVEGAFQDVTSFGAPGFDLSPRDDFGGTGLPVSWRAGLAVELL